MLFRFPFFTTSPSCFFSLNSSLTIQVAPAWPPPWLPYLLLHVVGKFSRLSVGHCFEAECLTGRRKEAMMGRGGRNEALEAKKQKQNRGSRLHGVEEELEAWVSAQPVCRWESAKSTQKTHSRFPNTFHHTQRTVAGSSWWLPPQEAVQKSMQHMLFCSLHMTCRCTSACRMR